jgi:hypothetical protein
MCGQWLDLSISVVVVFAESNRVTTEAATTSEVMIGSSLPVRISSGLENPLGRSAG